MKFKESENQPVVEVSIEAQEEKCPVKEAKDSIIKTYKKIINDRLELIDESINIIRRNMDRLYECGEDNDSREIGC